MLRGLGWRSGPFPREMKDKTLFLTQRNCYLREASGFGADLTAGSVDTGFGIIMGHHIFIHTRLPQLIQKQKKFLSFSSHVQMKTIVLTIGQNLE